MTPDHEDNRPSVVPQPAKDVWNPPMPDHTNPVPQPPIFVPPESETRPEAALEDLVLRIGRECADIKMGDSTVNLHFYINKAKDMIRAHVAAETADIKAQADALEATANSWHDDYRKEQLETAGLRALIVKQSEALSYQRWGLQQVSADPKGALMRNLDEALALTPKDLEDCVVVKRSELQALLVDVGQVFNGWHSDGTAWSEWDRSVWERAKAFLKL